MGGKLCTFLETEICCMQRFAATLECTIATGDTINNTTVAELPRLNAGSEEMPFLPFSNCSHALAIQPKDQVRSKGLSRISGAEIGDSSSVLCAIKHIPSLQMLYYTPTILINY